MKKAASEEAAFQKIERKITLVPCPEAFVQTVIPATLFHGSFYIFCHCRMGRDRCDLFWGQPERGCA
jgi:hypothetical protein